MTKSNWPPDYSQIIRERAYRLHQIREDNTGRTLAAFRKYYKTHPVDFVTDWMWTYDPRLPNPTVPFVLFDKQAEYLGWLTDKAENKSDGLVEKSRDMGLTWLNMAWSIHRWLFYDGQKISFGSRKEALVDKIGDPDSIFEKGREILRNLPPEFLPDRFNIDNDCPFMKIMNRRNGSTITGEAGDNIGRGGRSTIYFKDESAFYERPQRIEAALSQNSDVKIDVSTPNGTGNPFYRKRVGGVIPVFTFHWKDDPRKDQEWYEKQCRELDPIIVAQEIDIDYSASVEGVCIPAKWVRAAVDFDIEPSGAIEAGLDVADEGGDDNAIIIRHGAVVTHIDSWSLGNTSQTASKANSIAKEHGTSLIRYDSIGVGAGVKGKLSEIEDPVRNIGFSASDSPTRGEFTKDRKNKDMFANLKAEGWWKLRRRFEKTYEYANGISIHDIDELISIPDNQQLINELSQPKYEYNEAGKIKIESKKSMKARGIKSPNLADALVMAFQRTDKELSASDEFACVISVR